MCVVYCVVVVVGGGVDVDVGCVGFCCDGVVVVGC